MSQSATPATQNDMTTCLETFEKDRFCSFPHRHGDATGKPETRDETRGRSKTSMSCETSAHFDILWHSRHLMKQVGMSQSATPATQNDMTTCLETFEKERFCSFPQRHGDATGKPETRDETLGRSKTSMSCETSAHFDILWHSRHLMKQVGMSQSATPATQNDMTTCLETFEKERFCSFPHRLGINDPMRHWRRTRVHAPDPQTINGNPSLRIREKHTPPKWSKYVETPYCKPWFLVCWISIGGLYPKTWINHGDSARPS